MTNLNATEDGIIARSLDFENDFITSFEEGLVTKCGQ